MDPFRTIVEVESSSGKITYQNHILLLGSCFSDYIGEKLASLKFGVLHNPFGVLFNPLSLAENVRILLQGEPFTEDELYYYNGQWISFHHYTGYSHPHKIICLERINRNLERASAMLLKADFLFLTFGTAWVYKFNETGQVVANCHKLPSSAFTRYLLEPGDIIKAFEGLLADLYAVNKNIHVIFTLSPVRHWKDGAVNNQKSKSVLHYSIDKIVDRNPVTSYFPAYEIFMDELRDYRFYGMDMLHPSDAGIEYTWKRFTDVFIDPDSRQLMNEVTSLIKAVEHKPVNADDPSYMKFLQSTLSRIHQLVSRHTFLKFDDEIRDLSYRLRAII
jgi:hypothetical protein